MKKATEEIAELIKKFLISNGGNENGVNTNINGKIYSIEALNDSIINISYINFRTPTTNEFLVFDYDKNRIALITSIKLIMSKYDLYKCELISNKNKTFLDCFDIGLNVYKKDTCKIL